MKLDKAGHFWTSFCDRQKLDKLPSNSSQALNIPWDFPRTGFRVFGFLIGFVRVYSGKCGIMRVWNALVSFPRKQSSLCNRLGRHLSAHYFSALQISALRDNSWFTVLAWWNKTERLRSKTERSGVPLCLPFYQRQIGIAAPQRLDKGCGCRSHYRRYVFLLLVSSSLATGVSHRLLPAYSAPD